MSSGGTTGSGNPGSWILDDSTDPPTIRLQGDICGQIESAGAERIDIIYGCPTILR